MIYVPEDTTAHIIERLKRAVPRIAVPIRPVGVVETRYVGESRNTPVVKFTRPCFSIAVQPTRPGYVHSNWSTASVPKDTPAHFLALQGSATAQASVGCGV